MQPSGMRLFCAGTGEAHFLETMRSCMVILSRMLGYEDEDIWEYLENSFERLTWDWGYFALVVS